MATNNKHLLIVNPSDIALRLTKAGFAFKAGETLDITVVITREHQSPMPSKEVFREGYNAELIDLRREEWDSSVKFVSAIAYDFAGQSFLEGIQSQILLNNVDGNPKRIANYNKRKPEANEFLIECVSYNGRHVIIQCLKFGTKIEVETTFDSSWDNLAETVFAYLDSQEVINGPSQVYFNSNSEPVGLRLHPSNISYSDQLKATSRHWWDTWPVVVLLQSGSPNIAFRKFYEWYTKTGKTSKKYWFGSEGKLPD
jgi:hypothetical protein